MVQRNHIFGVKRGDAPGVGLEIVDQECLFDVEFIRQAFGLDDPGKIRSFHPAVAHRTGDTEARSVGTKVCGVDELGDNLVQARVVATGKDGSGNQIETPIQNIEKCQPGMGTTDVACEDHFSKSLQWRPSRSSKSSASFGPQVPAA